jgi:hypothetical protein
MQQQEFVRTVWPQVRPNKQQFYKLYVIAEKHGWVTHRSPQANVRYYAIKLLAHAICKGSVKT